MVEQSVTFPGGTSVSHLRVYDWPAPDAPGGSGTPHFHTTSTEAYVVVGGRGRVETLGPQGWASHGLVPGRIVWFSPGVIHRAINDGGLEVLVLMSNAGLPEAGDAVFTFPPEVLASQDAYARAAALPAPSPRTDDAPPAEHGRLRVDDASVAERDPLRGDDALPPGGRPPGAPSSGTSSDTPLNPLDDMAQDPAVAAAALARRDLALEGYRALRAAVRDDGPTALEPLWAAAARLVAGRTAGWREVWTASVGRALRETDAALAALAEADPATLTRGAVASIDASPGPRRYGMCGRLRVFPSGQ
ncbi:cupin domain-containing protein [Myceligenerans pegani]|uniref:Cupin domain-containing protein n=1 Tax=Myceligenerans pegani TaxID=2776917 RepID=A0ABR9N6J4_9MICO|nr:cupin domain-containing protein [Myceligenerans sp. TRM 65318]MBE1878753.1 cupin domain-containing protein [Myceligenerans sp. TRM 65318]MBE3021024.1 cupin domain-containing protein [Myceligenerans sp. TRM 65318]